ncbi:exopolysaccharide biosynthesis protein [Amycolatopsis sp. NPDC057786]|uniref:exopolysaccharide biosynthesis protein n=1 Tax=Amycolatopsis sp. NPDC057786 TaxID=3346250 RepID=UPI00366ED38F
MTDDTVRLSMIGQVLRGRWRTLVALAVLGALVGAGSSVILSPGYRTTSNVLLQGPREADELLTQAEVATSSVVLDRAAAVLGRGSGADLRDRVSTTVAQGNVITIAATDDSAEHAQQVADQVAQEFVKYSTQVLASTGDAAVKVAQERRETLRQQVAQTNQRISELAEKVSDGTTSVETVQLRTELAALRSSIEQAMSTLNATDTTSGGLGSMVVMGAAERPTSAAAPTLPQLALGGAALFFVFGLLGHLFAARTDRRLRDEQEIGAALGGPVLATVDIADEPDPEANRSLRAKLLGDDKPWNIRRIDVTPDEIDGDVHYRRLVSRLPRRRLLVLVAEGDHAARTAAARIAGLSGRRFTVVTVAPGRPVVEDEAAEGVLVVLGLGTRTAWELVGVAEACADAGLTVVGAALIRPVRPTRAPGAKPGKKAEKDREALAGTP